MSAARKSFALLAFALAMSACGSREAANNAAATDVEALPPDESAATPTDVLANGAAEPSNGNETGNVY